MSMGASNPYLRHNKIFLESPFTHMTNSKKNWSLKHEGTVDTGPTTHTTGLRSKWNGQRMESSIGCLDTGDQDLRQRWKWLEPTWPPRIALCTFCSNCLRFDCNTSAASLFNGSSGLGSKNKYWRPYTIELIVSTGFQSSLQSQCLIRLFDFVHLFLLLFFAFLVRPA